MRLNSGNRLLRLPARPLHFYTDCPLPLFLSSSPAVLVVSPFFFILHTSPEREGERERERGEKNLVPPSTSSPRVVSTTTDRPRSQPNCLARHHARSSNLAAWLDYHFIWQKHICFSALLQNGLDAARPSSSPLSRWWSPPPLHPTLSLSLSLSSISIPFCDDVDVGDRHRSFVRRLAAHQFAHLSTSKKAPFHFFGRCSSLSILPFLSRGVSSSSQISFQFGCLDSLQLLSLPRDRASSIRVNYFPPPP